MSAGTAASSSIAVFGALFSHDGPFRHRVAASFGDLAVGWGKFWGGPRRFLLGYQFNVNAFELLDVSEELVEKSREELLTSTSAELAIRCCGSRCQHLARRFYRRRCPLQGIHMHIRLHSAAATPSPAAFKTGKLKFKICTEKQFKVQIIVDLRQGPTVTVSPPAPSYLRREGELSLGSSVQPVLRRRCCSACATDFV